MENKEIEDKLLDELKVFSRKLNIALFLIILCMILEPVIIILNTMGIINLIISLILIIGVLVGLIMSIRMYNYNKIFYRTHIWILDSMLNKKPLL